MNEQENQVLQKIESNEDTDLENRSLNNLHEDNKEEDINEEEIINNEEEQKNLFQLPVEELPNDFALRCAIRIHTIFEKESDEDEAIKKVLQFINNHLNRPERIHYFVQITQLMINRDVDALNNITTTWISCIWYGDMHSKYKEFMFHFLDYCISENKKEDRETYNLPDTPYIFPAFAHIIGEVMINMINMSNDFYDILTEIYKYIIVTEMEEDLKEYEKRKSIQAKLKKTRIKESPSTYKKLYDDITDYIGQRAIFRSDTLEQKNPYEFIETLTEKMRTTRRYLIQDSINQHSLQQKKEFAMKLKSQEATAEEIIQSEAVFREGLILFWMQKKYNFKYIGIEKFRLTMNISGVSLCAILVLIGVNNILPITAIQAIMASAIVIPIIRWLTSFKTFQPFYPVDYTERLEDTAREFIYFLTKFSYQQISLFMQMQLKIYESKNPVFLQLLPEFVNFIIVLVPNKSKIHMTKEELSQIIEYTENLVNQRLKRH